MTEWYISAALVAIVVLFLHYLVRGCSLSTKVVLTIGEIIGIAAVTYAFMVLADSMEAAFVCLYPILAGCVLSRIVEGLVFLVCKLFKHVRGYYVYRDKAWILTIVLVAGLFAYGTLGAGKIQNTPYTVTASGLSQDYTVVFLSDARYGKAKDLSVYAEKIEEINQQKPDVVILGGDIVDEFSTRDDLDKAFAAFGKLNAKYGKYCVFGEDDLQSALKKEDKKPAFTREEFCAALEKNGFTLLEESTARINEDFTLVGRADSNSANRLAAFQPEIPEDEFVLTVDHQPDYYEENLAYGADLQLSGHLHAGQLFPMSLIENLTGKYPYGRYDLGKSDLIVTGGFSCRQWPYRTDGCCEYVTVLLKH